MQVCRRRDGRPLCTRRPHAPPAEHAQRRGLSRISAPPQPCRATAAAAAARGSGPHGGAGAGVPQLAQLGREERVPIRHPLDDAVDRRRGISAGEIAQLAQISLDERMPCSHVLHQSARSRGGAGAGCARGRDVPASSGAPADEQAQQRRR